MSAHRWRLRRGLVVGCGVIAAVLALNMPVTTKQGVNYEVSAHKIPVYLKAWEFADRSAQYRQIAQEIVEHATSDRDRVLAVFDWTRRRIKMTPDGWPVVDDHILNIIIRGYGLTDQQADVFATLVTYAGVPAFWRRTPAERSRPGVILSFARVDQQWRVFDVANGIVYRTASGELATLADISGHAELIPASVRDIQVEGAPYTDIIARAAMPAIPHPLRAELQMPLPRLWYELASAAGFEHTDESQR